MNLAKHQKMLDKLAELYAIGLAKVDRKMLAVLTDQSHKSSAYDLALRDLKKKEFILVYDGEVIITERGLSQGNPFRPLTTTLAEYHAKWKANLTTSEGKFFQGFVDNGSVHHYSTKEAICERVGLSATSSSTDLALRNLMKYGLIQKVCSEYSATSLMYPAGLK